MFMVKIYDLWKLEFRIIEIGFFNGEVEVYWF